MLHEQLRLILSGTRTLLLEFNGKAFNAIASADDPLVMNTTWFIFRISEIFFLIFLYNFLLSNLEIRWLIFSLKN